MTIRDALHKIGLSNPYEGFDANGIPLDLQGWASDHPWFASLISQTKARTIIEVGTWKGASAVNMARFAKLHHADPTVICVDTWLGSSEMWLADDLRPMLGLTNGIPTVYRQFLANVVRSGLTDTIFPMPMSSIAAAEALARMSVQADLVYLDGGHGEHDVYGDIMHYWPLVRPGGVMLGDDYWSTWPGVVRAVNRFLHETGLPMEVNMGKWFVVKPGGV